MKSATLAERPPLDLISRPTLTTEEAAHYLNRSAQRLRVWACKDNGPIQPVRINGRLHWRTEDVRKALQG